MLDKIALILVIIGALNWGGIGIFQFDTVAWLFGGQGAIISRIVYTLVALAGIWTISLLFRDPRRGSYPGLIPLWKSRQNIFPKQNRRRPLGRRLVCILQLPQGIQFFLPLCLEHLGVRSRRKAADTGAPQLGGEPFPGCP